MSGRPTLSAGAATLQGDSAVTVPRLAQGARVVYPRQEPSTMIAAADLAYRILYRGLLSRLPGRIAIPLGQWGLRLIPIDLVPIFRHGDPQLAVTLGGVRLPNPLILSSMYYDTTILRRAMGLGFGAVTTKSITARPRPGHPQPNLVRIAPPEGPGLVNCNGFQKPRPQAYRRAP